MRHIVILSCLWLLISCGSSNKNPSIMELLGEKSSKSSLLTNGFYPLVDRDDANCVIRFTHHALKGNQQGQRDFIGIDSSQFVPSEFMPVPWLESCEDGLSAVVFKISSEFDQAKFASQLGKAEQMVLVVRGFAAAVVPADQIYKEATIWIHHCTPEASSFFISELVDEPETHH